MTDCRSSFFLDETRSSSPCTWARTPFGPSSLMSLEIFLASSAEMPSLRPTPSRYSLPEGFGSPGSRALSETPRLTSLSLNTSSTALARSSLLARMSTAWSPDQAMDAPTPRKSNRVPISLAAWLRALSTSCRLIRLTMSKEDSAGIVCSFCGRALTDGQEVTALRRRARPGAALPVGSGRCYPCQPIAPLVRPFEGGLTGSPDAGHGFQRPAVRPVLPSLGGGTGRHGPPLAAGQAVQGPGRGRSAASTPRSAIL